MFEQGLRWIGQHKQIVMALTSVLFVGCMAPSRAQRAQESIYEANMGMRFGAMSGALEMVEPKARKAFIEQHGAWHKDLRIVDLEITGMSQRPDNDFDVSVVVAWQRSTETTMHVTTLVQRWGNPDGRWVWREEKRAQGDAGLVNDATANPQGATPTGWTSRYQTTVIRE